MTRKNERASREAEQVAQLQTVVASLPLVLLAFDREGTFTQYEGKGLEDAGRKQGELVGRSVFDYFGKVPGAREAVEGALAGRTTTWSGEFGGASVELVLLPVRGANGDVQSVTGVAIDVTQHTRAEAEKREADEMRNRLAAIVESTGDAVWSTDTEGRITAWNRSATRLFGYTAQQALGLNVAMLVPPDNRASDAALSLFGNVDMGDWIAEHETQRLHKDGTRVEVALTTSPIHDSDGKLIGRCAIARDLRAQRKAEAELRSTEEQLRQAQKLEAIGSLAGGIAHDFNNMLSVISSYVAMSLGSLDPETELAKDLQEVARAAERAAGLTSQLLAFSRRQILQPQVLDLGQLVNDVHGMLARVLGEAIRITVAPAAELGKVYADPGQVQQVLLNLVLNARDAMPEGGSLVIETANVFLDDAYAAAHHEVASGPYVMLAVSDTGAGMDADTVARIFEPFFTTKEMGKGTGLGLSMVFGIVKQSGGNISVHSEPGRGTTFKVYLPRTDRRTSDATRAQPPEKLNGHETVLLVEDEDPVRVAMRRILQDHGYQVLEAHEASEAQLVADRHPGEIHLLLSDVVLPGLSGFKLAERMVKLRPGIKVLLASGYTEHGLRQQGAISSGIEYLQKPITPNTLARRVRAVLDA